MTDDRKRRTNITFAYLCSKLPDFIILECILPHFNYFHIDRKQILWERKKEIYEAQKKIRHLDWKM